jgi:hypothetical protein
MDASPAGDLRGPHPLSRRLARGEDEQLVGVPAILLRLLGALSGRGELPLEKAGSVVMARGQSRA